MWPDRVSNPRPVALESDALPTALTGRAMWHGVFPLMKYQYTVISVTEYDHMRRSAVFLLAV